MNNFQFLGVVRDRPKLYCVDKESKKIIAKFLVVCKDKVNDRPQVLPCVVDNSTMANEIYVNCKPGTIICCSGAIRSSIKFDENCIATASVKLIITEYQIFKRTEEVTGMNLEEFLECYSPENIEKKLKDKRKNAVELNWDMKQFYNSKNVAIPKEEQKRYDEYEKAISYLYRK